MKLAGHAMTAGGDSGHLFMFSNWGNTLKPSGSFDSVREQRSHSAGLSQRQFK